MSKELEYVEALDKLLDGYSKGMAGRSYYDNVREALQRLEAIDKAEPSEALEKLKMLSDCAEAMKEAPSSNWIEYAKNETELDYKLFRAYEDLKSVLINDEKEHKALEVIKEKECDMRWFKYCIKGNLKVETYNNGLPEYYEKLTEEEFNLLKEVLE